MVKSAQIPMDLILDISLGFEGTPTLPASTAYTMDVFANTKVQNSLNYTTRACFHRKIEKSGVKLRSFATKYL